MEKRPFIIFALVLPFVAWHTDAVAQTDEEIEDLRNQLAEIVDPSVFGHGYASIVDFAVSRNISSATLNPDAGPGVIDPKIKSIRVPYRHVFSPDKPGMRPFIQGLFAYQYYEVGLETLPDERIDGEWTTYGASLSGGVTIPFGERLDILAAANLGYGRLENRADYIGPVSEGLQPVLEGLLFDWKSDALIYGASVGADYRRDVGSFDLEIQAGLSHHYVDSIDDDNAFLEYKDHITVLDIDISTVHATPWKIAGYPLSIVGLFGGTGLLGPNGDALGFDRFYEAGLALEADVTRLGWRVKSLRFGARAIFGPEVDGWGLIFGYGF